MKQKQLFFNVTCRDKIKQYIKKLEKRQKDCREKAKQLLLSKERDRAKIYLRQSKLHQEQIKISDGQLEMVENQIKQIESAQNLQECQAVLKQDLCHDILYGIRGRFLPLLPPSHGFSDYAFYLLCTPARGMQYPLHSIP